ncbi:serine/arginine-rich SC35-like splicing factor SCL33 isoform X1 [Gossypium raimondii]|uniref:serine/arginine-rich SC35-like splicing factor SCL33 isoform X1 n=1 Tax=Gossypium raimondii TaxID=29730 RepID=UPI00227D0690|nr:serine/arginine-rich SC35-like splicing factor SCL33 isoform X1 [Gossypium raimondii]XP_052485448.1 serine/arginine-rich SC35-like splicing factor SCL33 isoform X1 [Gossypium raimondii]
MRGRSYGYSPSPPRDYGRRRHRSPSPRGRYGGRGRDLPTSLLVRNLRHDCRPEDLRGPFGQFGRLKDVYLPRDYYTGQPRGFGFVQYLDPADAADAKYHMDGYVLLGRELTVVFAEENRKKPSEMRARERRRRSPPSYSRSPRYARSYSRSPYYYSPPPRKRRYSRSAVQCYCFKHLCFMNCPVDVAFCFLYRSISPGDKRYRERSYSSSPYGSRSPSRSFSRSRSQGLDYSR